MKIYRGKIKPISEDVVTILVNEGDIEVPAEQIPEVVLDIEAIIKEYLRLEEEVSSLARERLQKQGISYTEFGKLRRMIAEEKNFEMGDRALHWIAHQIIECFMINNRVAEIYSEDPVLRKKIIRVFGQYLGLEEQVDREARERIKNVAEGTPEWDIEYQRVYNQIARKKGLI
jgi:hypothetical protein